MKNKNFIIEIVKIFFHHLDRHKWQARMLFFAISLCLVILSSAFYYGIIDFFQCY